MIYYIIPEKKNQVFREKKYSLFCKKKTFFAIRKKRLFLFHFLITGIPGMRSRNFFRHFSNVSSTISASTALIETLLIPFITPLLDL